MISFQDGNNKFNFRLGAVILNREQTKVLLHTISGYGFYLLPGGRLEFMESCETGILRELDEELGLKNVNPQLIATMENFFTFKGVHFHEISNNFLVCLDSSHAWLEAHERIIGNEGDRYIYDWVPLADLELHVVKPPILREIIVRHMQRNQHYVLDER